MLLNCEAGGDSWESLGLQGAQTGQWLRKSVLTIHWKDWRWSWSSNTLATWFEETTHWKRPWCWERLKSGEGDDRGWDGWMASPTRWTWVWVNSGSWWRTGRPGVLQFMAWQKVGNDWVTELNWTSRTFRTGDGKIPEYCGSFRRMSFLFEILHKYVYSVSVYVCRYLAGRMNEGQTT